MPKRKECKWSQAAIFGIGVVAGASSIGTIALLMIDPTTLHKLENLIFSSSAAVWAGALGPAIAAFTAVGVGVSQHRETSRMLKQQIELDGKRYEREHIGPATAAYWRIANMVKEASGISALVLFSINLFKDYIDINGSEFHFNSRAELKDRLRNQEKMLNDEIISGSIQLSSALSNLNAARKAAQVAVSWLDDIHYIPQAEDLHKLVMETQRYLEATCDELAKEFPAIRTNVAGMTDYFRRKNTSNGGDRATP